MTAPSLLIVAPPRPEVTRWVAALSPVFEVRAVSDLNGARVAGEEKEPDLCIIDLALRAKAVSLVVRLRGFWLDTEFLAVGEAPMIADLIESINEANVQRYLAWDTPAEQVIEMAEAAWSTARTSATLRRRLRQILDERRQILEDHRVLVQQLSEQRSAMSDVAGRQGELRSRMEALLSSTIQRSNVLTMKELQNRIMEEIEKNHRYQHPVSILVLHGIGDPNDSEESLLDLARLASDRVRHIDLVAADRNRIVVLMPVTDREQAKTVQQRLVTGLEEELVVVNIANQQLMSYPDDADLFLNLARRPVPRHRHS